MVTFEKEDKIDWEKFRAGTKSYLEPKEFELICQLHAKYYKHQYYKPCTCNPKIIKLWIKQLNIIWNNENI
tara:strand:- start:497 stop:709 length:213 start_codon:yes stop_codon:yes gene_type:complete